MNRTLQTRLEQLEESWNPPEKAMVLRVRYVDALERSVTDGPWYTYVQEPGGWRLKGEVDEIA